MACNFSPEAQIGAMEPLGFFDPAGFCKDEASFKDLRAKELKHGRLLESLQPACTQANRALSNSDFKRPAGIQLDEPSDMTVVMVPRDLRV